MRNDFVKRHKQRKDKNNRMAAVLLDGKYIYVDITGRDVVPVKYQKTYWFKEGLSMGDFMENNA